MHKWAKEAKLPDYQVMGKGAISAEDPRVGQGVWLLIQKKAQPKCLSQNVAQPPSAVQLRRHSRGRLCHRRGFGIGSKPSQDRG